MAVIDFYGNFARAEQSCSKCGWSGFGAEMPTRETFGDGVEKDCPNCGERWGFVQYSVNVSDDPPAGWKANIGRIAD